MIISGGQSCRSAGGARQGVCVCNRAGAGPVPGGAGAAPAPFCQRQETGQPLVVPAQSRASPLGLETSSGESRVPERGLKTRESPERRPRAAAERRSSRGTPAALGHPWRVPHSCPVPAPLLPLHGAMSLP